MDSIKVEEVIRLFSTTKNGDSLTERKYLGKQMERQVEEISAKKEYSEESTRAIYFQFLLIARQPLLLI